MNKLVLGTAAVFAFAMVGCNKADLKSDKGQASYAIGQQIGKNLKAQNIEIDAATLSVSLKDAMAGKSEMKDDEIQITPKECKILVIFNQSKIFYEKIYTYPRKMVGDEGLEPPTLTL